MTISTTVCSVTAQGNGATTIWNYAFIIPYQVDGTTPAVDVFIVDPVGVVTALAPGDFTIANVGNPAGGTVTYPLAGDPLPIGWTITITRDLALTQETAVLNTSFLPNVVEQVADKEEMQIQQVAERLGRAITVAPGRVLNPLGGPATLKNTLLGFDTSSQPYVLTQAQAQALFKGDPGGNVMSIGLWSAFPTMAIPTGADRVQTSGYSVRGKGAAAYVLDADQTSVTVSATRNRSANGKWYILNEPFPTVQQTGALGDGTTDDSAAQQAGITYAIAGGTNLFWPDGNYKTTTTLLVGAANEGNFFHGDGGAIITWAGADGGQVDLFRVYNAYYFRFYGLQFKGLTQTTLINFKGDVLHNPRPDGRGARNGTCEECQFFDGRYQVRWTTIDRDFNNEQGTLKHCLFSQPYFAGVSVEHSNSLWHRVEDCEFTPRSGAWAINTVNDQNGNSYVDPAYDGIFGGSGIHVERCNMTDSGAGWLRVGPMRYGITFDHCNAEGTTNFVYTPTNRATFHGDFTSTSQTVTNVSNIGQLVVGDLIWNTNVPIGTTIFSINVGANSMVVSNAATATQANSVVDAGYMLNPGNGKFELLMRDMTGNAWNNGPVNPLIAIDMTSVGGNVPFYVSFDEIAVQPGTNPFFIAPIGKRGKVSLRNIGGESFLVSMMKCDVTMSGFVTDEMLMTEDCCLDSVGCFGFPNNQPNCLFDGANLLTQQAREPSVGIPITPTGSYRYFDNAYPATPITVTKISGIPEGATRTIVFNGNITLNHGGALVLLGGLPVTPPANGAMTFIGRGVNGCTEIMRTFDKYTALSKATAAAIIAIGNAINITGKYEGKVVYDTDNHRLMRATGPAAGDGWYVVDGSALVTPV